MNALVDPVMHMSTALPTGRVKPVHGAVAAGDALAAFLRQMPEPGRSVVRPVAEQLEGRR